MQLKFFISYVNSLERRKYVGLIFFHPGKNSMLTCPRLHIQILFTNYDIITDFLNLAFCSEHFIRMKHRILATFNINKKFNSDSRCAFNATFNNISVILRRSVLLVEGSSVHRENQWPVARGVEYVYVVYQECQR